MLEIKVKDENDDQKVIHELHELNQIIKECCYKVIKKKDPCLCSTLSVCSETTYLQGVSYTTVTIPANSCITKIYAAGGNDVEIDYAYEITIYRGTKTLYCHRFFPKEYGVNAVEYKGAEFETTFIQPLCVGKQDVTVRLEKIVISHGGGDTDLLLQRQLEEEKEDNEEMSERLKAIRNAVPHLDGTLTVVYCPDCY